MTSLYFYFCISHHSSKYSLWSSVIFYFEHIPDLLFVWEVFSHVFKISLWASVPTVYPSVLPVLTQPTPAHTCWLPSYLEKPQCSLDHHENTMPLPRGTFRMVSTFPFLRHINGAEVLQQDKWEKRIGMPPWTFYLDFPYSSNDELSNSSIS